VARNSLYTKRLYQPLDASEQTARIQRRCANPIGPQKPFPYATNGSTCNQLQGYYVTPPAWYYYGDNDQINEQRIKDAKEKYGKLYSSIIKSEEELGVNYPLINNI